MKIFYFVKSFYMGKMGKQDGRPGQSLGKPLNMLKTLVSGAKINQVHWLGNLKHTIFFILGLRIAFFLLIFLLILA